MPAHDTPNAGWADNDMTDAKFSAQRWMATLAHELRAPLSVIAMSLELLSEDISGGASGRHNRDIASASATQMADIIEDILDLCRCHAGKLQLKTEMTELNRIVGAAVRNAHSEICRRNHHLTVSIPSERLCVNVNPSRMIQILTNLLINAAKYTRPGGNILLGAELIQGMLLVRVRDDGIGISPEMLDQVFETYWQVPSLNEGPSKGLGIGLSLVKSLVELHGGTIRAYSQGLGAGAEFVVQVPSGCDVDQPAQAGVAKACGSGSSISNHI